MSWFLYQQRQDTILQLRGVEQRLVHSAVELHRLRSQINPHFLFNALNTLYGTALKERAGATAEGVQRLGDMMRFMLEENTQDFIALDREIGYLENYIALQKLRTPPSPTLRIETMIQPPSRPYRIAPMLLLPFVENAFKHGISHKEPSWVRIQLTCEQDSLRFEVRNSRHVRAPNDLEKPGMGIGLQNVTERLRLLYDGRYHLSCQEEGTDFVVHLVLPLSTYE
nr:histidine kinase [Hymenobacter citatus]